MNDAPQFNFSPSSYNIDEDSGEYNIDWAFDIKPGGGDGAYKEDDQHLSFVIADTYDQTLFNPLDLPKIDSVGVLSFTLGDNMNGQTVLSITLEDDGDNQLNDDDDLNDLN